MGSDAEPGTLLDTAGMTLAEQHSYVRANPGVTVMYSLPVALIGRGMSTDDGQDIVDRFDDSEWVSFYCVTPGFEDPDLRMKRATEGIGLATFPDTPHRSGHELESAVIDHIAL